MFIALQITTLVAQKGPDEGAEFASDGADDLVAHEAPCGQTYKAGVEPVWAFQLRASTSRDYPLWRCESSLLTFWVAPRNAGHIQ